VSFILDALKKSENDRQGASPAEFTTVSSGASAPSAPRWLWVLVALLAVNALVLAVLLLKPDSPAAPVAAAPTTSPATVVAPATADTVAQATPAATAPVQSDFSTRVAEARRDRPAPRSPLARRQRLR
jgi:hypothetical protein